jgi:hypothetical protein
MPKGNEQQSLTMHTTFNSSAQILFIQMKRETDQLDLRTGGALQSLVPNHLLPSFLHTSNP